MKRYVVSVLGAALLLAGCSPKINTDNPKDYASSIAKITAEMSDDEKADFREAMLAILFDGSRTSSGALEGTDLSAPLFMAAGDRIKGKTAPQIIKLGLETKIAALDGDIKQVVADVQRMQKQIDQHKAVFDNIHLDNARYFITNDYIIKPALAFKVTNNSKIPIARIFVHGLLTSPGRTIPWVSDNFNYEFSGGLEPGESQHLDLAPNMFGAWKVDDRYSRRDDLKLELTLVNVEDASGKRLLDGDPGDTKKKQEELKELEKLRTEMQAKLTAL